MLGLNQWVLEGTFHPSETILDLIFTSDHDVVGEVSVLPPLPGCHHSPVICEYFFANFDGSSDDTVANTRMWNKGNYKEVDDYLMSVNWVGLFEGGDADQNYLVLMHILQNLIEAYIPCDTMRADKPTWKVNPPRSLMQRRSRAWQRYKQLRSDFGRTHSTAELALEHFKSLNSEYRNYTRQQQCSYELGLMEKFSRAPKLFHAYIRRRKRGKSSVGPLKINGSAISSSVTLVKLLPILFLKSTFPVLLLSLPRIRSLLTGCNLLPLVMMMFAGYCQCLILPLLLARMRFILGFLGPVHPHYLLPCQFCLENLLKPHATAPNGVNH